MNLAENSLLFIAITAAAGKLLGLQYARIVRGGKEQCFDPTRHLRKPSANYPHACARESKKGTFSNTQKI